MNVHIAAVIEYTYGPQLMQEVPNPKILQSFYYYREEHKEMLPLCGSFMMDSGAFTYMYTAKKECDFNAYVDDYIRCINDTGTELFFEMDVDSVIGYKAVRELRRRLEKGVQRPCIPVWHSGRGKQDFIEMCKDYPYVAMGGIDGNRWGRYELLPWFIDTAHSYGTKIHGLGFTSIPRLKYCHFDSVDSSSWLAAPQYGILYNFEGENFRLERSSRKRRLRFSYESVRHNYVEWCRFSKWAETHL